MVDMGYVDGYVLSVPKKNLPAYRRLALKAGKLWREHGALDYKECVGDDLNTKMGVPFPKSVKIKSRTHRDHVNAKVMKDPRIQSMCDPKDMPFDCTRMVYGGFKVLVDV
jgi:uncharacterized protein YbaA (DUF1428 family)